MGQSSTSAIKPRGGLQSLTPRAGIPFFLSLGPTPFPQHLLWAVSNFLPSPHPPFFYPSCSGLAWAIVAPTLWSEQAEEGWWVGLFNPPAFSVYALHPLTPTPDLTLPR